jgi:N-acyl-D-amino-acid deacylase
MRCALSLLLLAACSGAGTTAAPPAPVYDVIVRGGTVVDGRGGRPFAADVAIRGDRIAAVGALGAASARTVIDARGLAVAPGFINTLSHSEDTLIQDGRALSDIRQGVTLEIFGEISMGPLNDEMRGRWKAVQSTVVFDLDWTTLDQYLRRLERRGIAVNVASLVGAGTVRERVLGMAARSPSPAELAEMERLVAQAMDEGALGLTNALIYPPDAYQKTDEIIALARVAAARGGVYTVHIRSEGNRIEEALDEVLRIAREAGIPVEIYHLKLAGRANWSKLDSLLAWFERARAGGVAVSANMYTYIAGATGLDAAMPPWVQEGGIHDWIARLRDPAVRARVRREMESSSASWENLFAYAGPDGIRFLEFKQPALRRLLGRSLAEVAAERGVSPAEAAMDLVIEDGTRVGAAYFLMSEDNLRRQIARPWVSFGSDAAAQAPGPPFTDAAPHPRAYGNFARLFARYVRDEHILSLEEAVRRLTSLPAATYHLDGRGALTAGSFADVVVFDPARIQDHATFERPHQLATGVIHVLTNGVPVLRDGEPTGATPGRIVRRHGAAAASSPRPDRRP